MKYVCLVYLEEQKLSAVPDRECMACGDGFYLIEASDLDEAIELATTIPPAREGSIEVRPVRELTP
jgi:hypothetical protein